MNMKCQILERIEQCNDLMSFDVMDLSGVRVSLDKMTSNNPLWSKYRLFFDIVDCVRQEELESTVGIVLPNGDILIPDVFMLTNNTRRSRQILQCVCLCEHARWEYSKFESLLKWEENKDDIIIKILWEKDIKDECDFYNTNGYFKRSMGKKKYHGIGTIYAVDIDDLRLYALSHSVHEIKEHYHIRYQDTDTIRSYLQRIGCNPRAVVHNKEFPCPYQTIEREQLPKGVDIVVNFGQHENRVWWQLWRDANEQQLFKLYVRQVEWNRYQDNAELRQDFLADMEALGFIENRLDNVYGLVYEELDDGRIFIPDFFDPIAGHQGHVVFVNDVTEDGKTNITLLTAFEAERKKSISRGRGINGFAISEIETLRSVFNDECITRRNWGNRTMRARCCYVLEHVHDVQKRTEAEIAYSKQLFSRKARREELDRMAEENVTAIKERDDAVSHFRHMAEEIGRISPSISLFQYADAISDVPSVDDIRSQLRSPLMFAHDVEELPGVSSFEDELWHYEVNEELRYELVPFIEAIGGFENIIENELGLGYVQTNDNRYIIPDFIICVEGRIEIVKIFNREYDDENYFNHIWAIYRRSIASRKAFSCRTLWTGYQMQLFRRDVIMDTLNWSCYKIQYLGRGNKVWDMLNDPGFREYYWEHSAKDTCKYYDITKQQLEHVIYRYQEFRRPDRSRQIMNVVKAREDMPDPVFSRTDGAMVSKEELSLIPLLETIGIVHNDSEHRSDGVKYFNVYGITTMHPDFISEDENIIVEFDGEYFHLDPAEAEFRRLYYESIGKRCSIIWECEYDEFVANPPATIEELLEKYPCTWRNDRAETYYVLHHRYDSFVSSLKEKIATQNDCG